MQLEEAKKILEKNDYVLDKLEDLGVEVNNGIQDTKNVQAYEIHLSNPICPCCGKKLKVVNKNVKTDEFIGESTLNENTDSRYISYYIQDIAEQLYQEELDDFQPDVDAYGNVSLDYLERFTKPELKGAVSRAATKLANDLKEENLNINPWYLEQEIYEELKKYAKFGGVRYA